VEAVKKTIFRRSTAGTRRLYFTDRTRKNFFRYLIANIFEDNSLGKCSSVFVHSPARFLMSVPLHAQTHAVQSREFRCKRLRQGWRFMSPIARHYDAVRQDDHKTVRCTRCYWPQYITSVYLPTCDRHSLIAICALLSNVSLSN